MTYRNRKIEEQVWTVNGQKRRVFVIDSQYAPDGHFDTLEDAQRFIRRRS